MRIMSKYLVVVLTQIFHSFRILKCFDQIKCHVLFFLHKILNNKVIESICETFALMWHSYNTRSINQIIIPQTNTIFFFGTYSIKYQCINIWNLFSNIFQDQNLQ